MFVVISNRVSCLLLDAGILLYAVCCLMLVVCCVAFVV